MHTEHVNDRQGKEQRQPHSDRFASSTWFESIRRSDPNDEDTLLSMHLPVCFASIASLSRSATEPDGVKIAVALLANPTATDFSTLPESQPRTRVLAFLILHDFNVQSTVLVATGETTTPSPINAALHLKPLHFRAYRLLTSTAPTQNLSL
jgi:hypothetical protein